MIKRRLGNHMPPQRRRCKPMNESESQTKHSFNSDADATAILSTVAKAELNKVAFINRCIRLAGRAALQALIAERKLAEQAAISQLEHFTPPLQPELIHDAPASPSTVQGKPKPAHYRKKRQ